MEISTISNLVADYLILIWEFMSLVIRSVKMIF